MKHVDKNLRKYGLVLHNIERRDLSNCYMQSRPNCEYDDGVLGRIENPMRRFSMVNSPHLEFAMLYYKNGKRWMTNNYNKTRYKVMCFKYKRKKKFPDGFIDLCNSIKEGYLRNGFNDDYIVLLDEPFAKSRFKRSVLNLVPEVWSGHHRAGAILALSSINESDSFVDVAIAKDTKPGTMKSSGKIHSICVDERI
jgi:hypothetical protein